MSESSLRVIVLSALNYPYFELDNEHDEIRKALLIKPETEWIEWIPSILESFLWGRLFDRGRLLERGV